MKQRILGTLVLSVATLIALSGCGSSSSSDDEENKGQEQVDKTPAGGDTSGDTSGDTQQLVSYSCESTSEFDGVTYVSKLGANGSLVCDETYSMPMLAFAPGINEMAVSQLIAVLRVDFTQGNGTYTINLQEGTEELSGKDSEHGNFACVNKYDVPTPLYVYDASDLLFFDIEEYPLISTTCPDWLNEDYDDDDDDYEDDEHGTMYQNITITEESGDISKVSYSSSN